MALRTPRSHRLHIGIYGRRNAGKSTLLNALVGRDVAIVSDVPGTTTDPVFYDVDHPVLGPITLIDTAGIDDIGALGALRVERTLKCLAKTDVMVLVVDPARGFGEFEQKLYAMARERGVPVVIAVNKADAYPAEKVAGSIAKKLKKCHVVVISALKRRGLDALVKAVSMVAPDLEDRPFLEDLVEPGDLVIFNIPIDLGAPKGRLIYPQVEGIRSALEAGAPCVVVKERELRWAIEGLRKKPKLVVTDSHAFMRAVADTPRDVLFTSFSILEARYRGDLFELLRGVKAIEKLRPGDRVLIAEACTHHPSPDDIGRVKIPRWLRNLVGGDLEFEFVMGGDFPEDLRRYKLIIHCGACMISRREMLNRIRKAKEQGVPITNYGLVIAYVHGVLYRALSPFPEARKLLEELGEREYIDAWRRALAMS